jgi:hypothetical protein
VAYLARRPGGELECHVADKSKRDPFGAAEEGDGKKEASATMSAASPVRRHSDCTKKM